jgi:hypothetical protein
MYKHHGENKRNKKSVAFADIDTDWGQPRSKSGRIKALRTRPRPYDRHSRTNRIDWLEDMEKEFY